MFGPFSSDGTDRRWFLGIDNQLLGNNAYAILVQLVNEGDMTELRLEKVWGMKRYFANFGRRA